MRAGDVGPDRFGGASAQGGEVFADDLVAPEVAAFRDLQERAGAADPILCFGEAGVGVWLEWLPDAVGPSVAGGDQSLITSLSWSLK